MSGREGALLFQPFPLGRHGRSLPNRIWVPARVTWRGTEDGFVTPAVREIYLRYAQGGAGMIVLEATGVRDVASGPLLRLSHKQPCEDEDNHRTDPFDNRYAKAAQNRVQHRDHEDQHERDRRQQKPEIRPVIEDGVDEVRDHDEQREHGKSPRPDVDLQSHQPQRRQEQHG